MKRILAIFTLLLPTAVLIFFRLFPQADSTVSLPLFHFYVVTFTSFAAAVISILLGLTLGENAQARHVLVAAAFATIAIIFFSHGFATPNALIGHSHPAVAWSAWLTLFAGGVLFTIAGQFGSEPPSSTPLQTVVKITAVLVTLYLLVAAFAPQLLDQISTQATPWHQQTIFFLTLLAWLYAAYRFWRCWRQTQSPVDASLMFVAVWLADATISMHHFGTWHLSWWLYHFLLLASFLFMVYMLVIAYEQTRQFNLLRYYLAIALIFTALLALVVSDLFARFSYNTLVKQIEQDTTETISTLMQEIGHDLPADASAFTIRNTLGERLETLNVGTVLIYNENGRILYPDNYRLSNPIDEETFQAALSTLSLQPDVKIISPEAAPADYAAEDNTYLSITFAPVYSPSSENPLIGILALFRTVPELGPAVLLARQRGLLITVATMSIMFIALYLVVRRADRIITNRTSELSQAYRELRRSEGMRNDLTNMIAHDLRNPLTTISTSLGLLGNGNGPIDPERRKRFLLLAEGASQRMMGLIDDMLTVSKLEAGELPIKLERTEVAELLAAHIQAFTPQATSDNKQLTLTCPPDLTADLDTTLIGRVVDNLIANALKYTDVDTGKIEVCAGVKNGRLCFHVVDNGEGIPDAYKQTIFDKYAQAPNAFDTPSRKGTGLGLTFCCMVIQAHQGEIKVQDAPGRGSDFVFWLPQYV